MRIPISSQKLMADLGLIPPHCQSVELHIPAAGLMVLRFDVIVTADHLEKLALVFQAMASEVKPGQDVVR